MSGTSYELELRAAAPPAPPSLRDRVRALPEPHSRPALRLRPALSVAVGIALAVGIGAAALGGLRSSGPAQKRSAATRFNVQLPSRTLRSFGKATPRPGEPFSLSTSGSAAAPKLAQDARLKRQDISMRLRVSDLSGATRAAVRRARRLGGYVAAADYSTSTNGGDSFLDLRVPAGRVQAAIAGFTELGDILSQHIAVQDLQAGVDRLDTRIAASERLLKNLTGDEQKRAALALGRLERRRAALVGQAAYARVALQLTSSKPAAKQATPPGRFDRFWNDSGDILSRELVGVLYFLVVVGPFALLAAFAILAERERRRRSGNRLLEEAG